MRNEKGIWFQLAIEYLQCHFNVRHSNSVVHILTCYIDRLKSSTAIHLNSPLDFTISYSLPPELWMCALSLEVSIFVTYTVFAVSARSTNWHGGEDVSKLLICIRWRRVCLLCNNDNNDGSGDGGAAYRRLYRPRDADNICVYRCRSKHNMGEWEKRRSGVDKDKSADSQL